MLGFVLTGLISLPNWNIDAATVGVKNSVGTVKVISSMTRRDFADKLNPQSPIDGTSTWYA